jgi:hypothetical protein
MKAHGIDGFYTSGILGEDKWNAVTYLAYMALEKEGMQECLFC